MHLTKNPSGDLPHRYRQRKGCHMIKLMTAVLPLLFAVCSGVPVYAQSNDWDKLNEEALSLYRQGHYDPAIVIAKKALRVAEQTVNPNHAEVAESLNNIAELYRAQGQYAQALPLLKRSLATEKRHSDLIIPMLPRASITLRVFTTIKVSTRRPCRFTNARWRSERRPMARIIPMWPRV